MNILNNVINIFNFFNSESVITRYGAQDLGKYLQDISEKEIILDFKNINYTSRSFIDELNNEINELKKIDKKIIFINQSEDTKKLFDLVKNQKKNKVDRKIINKEDIKYITI